MAATSPEQGASPAAPLSAPLSVSAPRPSPVQGGRVVITRTGTQAAPWSDLYHFLMAAPWRHLFLLIAFGYLFINTAFALGYLAGGDCLAEARPGSFQDAFFFSVQTMATIGYGRMYPKTTYADVLVTAEAFCGLVGVAMATGLIFAKFARPTARIIFSKVAVISNRDGVPTLMIRIANERSNTIVEAQVRLILSITGRTSEGERVRRILDLVPMRDNSPIFTLTWTVMHPIDEKSPIYDLGLDGLLASDAAVLVTFTGIDETLTQTVHARHAYGTKDLVMGARFADILTPRAEGGAVVDYGRFNDTQEAPMSAFGKK